MQQIQELEELTESGTASQLELLFVRQKKVSAPLFWDTLLTAPMLKG